MDDHKNDNNNNNSSSSRLITSSSNSIGNHYHYPYHNHNHHHSHHHMNHHNSPSHLQHHNHSSSSFHHLSPSPSPASSPTPIQQPIQQQQQFSMMHHNHNHHHSHHQRPSSPIPPQQSSQQQQSSPFLSHHQPHTHHMNHTNDTNSSNGSSSSNSGSSNSGSGSSLSPSLPSSLKRLFFHSPTPSSSSSTTNTTNTSTSLYCNSPIINTHNNAMMNDSYSSSSNSSSSHGTGGGGTHSHSNSSASIDSDDVDDDEMNDNNHHSNNHSNNQSHSSLHVHHSTNSSSSSNNNNNSILPSSPPPPPLAPSSNTTSSNTSMMMMITPMEQHLLSTINQMHLNPDVCFIVQNGEQRVYAHKILLARSTIFHHMFYHPLFNNNGVGVNSNNSNNNNNGNSNNGSNNNGNSGNEPLNMTVIDESTCSMEAFLIFLHYMYLDRIPPLLTTDHHNNLSTSTTSTSSTWSSSSLHNVIQVSQLANKYSIVSLEETCERYMNEHCINDEHVFQAFVHARTLNMRYLEMNSLKYILHNANRLLNVNNVNNNNNNNMNNSNNSGNNNGSGDGGGNRLSAFYDLCHEEVMVIANHDSLNMSEMALFQAIVNWGIKQVEKMLLLNTTETSNNATDHMVSMMNDENESQNYQGTNNYNNHNNSSNNNNNNSNNMLPLLIRVLNDLIYSVRYALMDQVDFVKIVRPTNLLSHAEMLDIASFYITRDSRVLLHHQYHPTSTSSTIGTNTTNTIGSTGSSMTMVSSSSSSSSSSSPVQVQQRVPRFITTPRRSIRILILGGDRDERIENVRRVVEDQVRRRSATSYDLHDCVVEKFNANKKMISRKKLFEYSAVLTFSNSSNFVDRSVMGDLLAEYAERNNGGLVITTFANSGGLSLKGKLADGDLCPCVLGSSQHDYSTADNPMIVLDGTHPILRGVDRFILGKYRCKSPLRQTKDGRNKLLATWPDDVPAIAVRCDRERVVILNFFAVNSELISESWNKNQPAGAQILLNSLLWSSYAI